MGARVMWRTTPLPSRWYTHIVPAVLRRDAYVCKWPKDGMDCYGRMEVDHIGDHNDHTLSNLRTLCYGHHKLRTRMQLQQARGITSRSLRPKGKHPGLA